MSRVPRAPLHHAARRAVGAAVVMLALGSCAASTADYRDDGEEFLLSDEIFGAYNINFSNPVCTEPSSTKVDETVTCTADGDDGNVYTFTLRIVGKNEMSLEAISPVTAVAAPAPGDSTPESVPGAASTSAPGTPTSTAATTSTRPTTTVAAPSTVAPTTSIAPTTTVPAAPAG